MSQFDESTVRKAEEYKESFPKFETPAFNWRHVSGFKAGRNSAKESLEILAKKFEWMLSEYNEWEASRMLDEINEAIAKVKARGDWPL